MSITAEITVSGGVTPEVGISGGITVEVEINGTVTVTTNPFEITGVVITVNQVTQINTGQSTRKPRQVSFYDEVADKCIDKSLPGWTSRQNGNWFIDVPKQLISYTNVTVHWI